MLAMAKEYALANRLQEKLKMFDKLKDIAGNASKMWEMKKQFTEMKKMLDSILVTEEDYNVKITMNGSQEVKDVEIKCNLKEVEPYQLQVSIKDVLGKCMKRAQKEAADKMAKGGFGFPGL